MVSCDISVNNVLAVVNSRLVGHYVRLDDRVRTLGLCIKAWAAARRINDRSRGTISSFALVLMLIHFLQRRDPPVLPSLQDIAFSQNEKPKFVNGVDCRFCTDAGKIREELAYLRGARSPNEEDVATLLLEFFRYFGKDYRSGIIRIRDTRSMLPPGDETKCFLVVDNPFEVGKDVANIDASQQSALRKDRSILLSRVAPRFWFAKSLQIQVCAVHVMGQMPLKLRRSSGERGATSIRQVSRFQCRAD
ncbi:URT1 [Symbiodinium sp. CCMP2456]|nr:URT1 [Symbiodinium sp. CCMP2456]